MNYAKCASRIGRTASAAVHLDPGELEAILKDQDSIAKVRKAVFSIFK